MITENRLKSGDHYAKVVIYPLSENMYRENSGMC